MIGLGLAVLAPQGVRAQDGADAGTFSGPVPMSPQVAGGTEMDRRCLALAVAYEAGNEPLAGQQAVAEVVLNRRAHPAFPKSVCGVVFQGWRRGTGCQFTFTCDGAMRRRLSARTLLSAQAVAEAALDGTAPSRVPGALNYHADYVRPYWAPTLDRVAKLGAHIFYKPQQGGVPVSGKDRDWSGDEPDPATVARAFAVPASTVIAGAVIDGAGIRAPRSVQHRVVPPAAAPGTFAPWGLALQR